MGTDYLNGWDAMVATSQANINAAMVLAYNANLLPHSLKKEFTITVFDFDIPAKVDSRLGAWRLSGGSGKNAVISIPFTGGTLTLGKNSYPLAGVVLQVTCLLSYIKSPIKPVSGTDYTLRIDFTSPNAIVAVQVINPPPKLDQTSIEIALLNFLKNGIGGHTYDLATVNLQYVQKNYPYLVPTLFQYAIDTDTVDPNRSTFGVQMLTLNTTPGNQDIIRGTVPTGTPECNSAALVSNQIFAQKVLLPGIAQALHVDASKLASRFTAGTWTIVNTENITLPGSYDPIVTSLTANVDNNLVRVDVKGHCEASPGIDIFFTISAKYAMKIATSGTTQTINLEQQGAPVVDHSVQVAAWVIIVASALIALVYAVLGVVAALIVAGIYALIVIIIAAIANNKAGDILKDSMPSIVADGVKWNHMDLFTLRQANLPTPLQLGGIMPILSKP
jgi:hypothetical protein